MFLGVPAVLLGSFSEIVDNTVAGGYLIAMALVCLVQYLFYMYHRNRARQEREQFRREVHGLEGELRTVQKDRTLSRLENHILREFVTQTEIEKAIDLLLRKFIPQPSEGLGAFVRLEQDKQEIKCSRGLTHVSGHSLRIDPTLLERVRKEQVVTLTESDLQGSELITSLSKSDRRKVKELFLLAVAQNDELMGTVVLTALYPPRAPQDQQIELARRLMQSMAGNMKRTQSLELKETQLRSTSEMLELRAIIDRPHDSPVLMVEEFLDCLRKKVGAERCAMHIPGTNGSPGYKSLVRCGETLPSRILQRWNEHEDTLTVNACEQKKLVMLDSYELQRWGVDSLVGRAIVAPLTSEQNIIGIVSLTKSSRRPFTDAEVQLASWASEFVASALLRVLSHAEIERQARQDSLTGLANRRTFDVALHDEIELAAQTDSDCSLLLFDIDHFKHINDTYGHQAGDDVLKQTADLLQQEMMRIRSTDCALAARYGGEELAVLLPSIGSSGATRIADAIRQTVNGHAFRFRGVTLNITISAGTATYPMHGDSAEELVAAADGALYQAKQSGRNRVCCVSDASA